MSPQEQQSDHWHDGGGEDAMDGDHGDGDFGDDDGFDYDDFVAREFGDSPIATESAGWVRWTAIVILVAIVLPFLAAVFR